MSDNCAYCHEGELLARFGIKIRELKSSKVYLFREQSHRGRVIVACKRHVSEIIDLPAAERRAFMDDVALVASVLRELFHPDKINYGAYGDTGCHLHFHLVPKYADDQFEWGDTFAMNPGRVHLSDTEYMELVAKISAALLLASGDGLRESLVKLRREIADDGRIDFDESSVLLAALTRFEDSDNRIAILAGELRKFREDHILTHDESQRLIEMLDRLIG